MIDALTVKNDQFSTLAELIDRQVRRTISYGHPTILHGISTTTALSMHRVIHLKKRLSFLNISKITSTVPRIWTGFHLFIIDGDVCQPCRKQALIQ